MIKTKENPEGERVSRKYTPISWIFEEGKFKLLIKVYHKNVLPQFPEGGKMSQYLNDLTLGSNIQVRGPFGKITYLGNGKFKIL
jgi:NAD(P)H-flavin reductase